MRQLMKRKRKSNKDVDRVEDGGRAIAIEEGISALVFDYAHDHAYLEGVNHVDYGILRTVKHLTRHWKLASALSTSGRMPYCKASQYGVNFKGRERRRDGDLGTRR